MLLHILSAASAFFLLGDIAQARQSILAEEKPQSCKVRGPGPGINCTFYLHHTTYLDGTTTDEVRSTLLSFPSTWSLDQVDLNPYPLILSFHGRTKDSAEQEKLTGFSDNTINAIAAYPQGGGQPVGHCAKGRNDRC